MTLKKFGDSGSALEGESNVGKVLARMTSIDLNQAAYHTIVEACRDDRLIYGVDASAKFLMTDPDGVFACLLPMDGYRDITTQIYYKLLEAYCNENYIPLIQVDSASKLSQLISENGRETDGKDGTTKDCTVILIRSPYTADSNHVISEYAKQMARYVANYQKYAHPIPLIVLPTSVD